VISSGSSKSAEMRKSFQTEPRRVQEISSNFILQRSGGLGGIRDEQRAFVVGFWPNLSPSISLPLLRGGNSHKCESTVFISSEGCQREGHPGFPHRGWVYPPERRETFAQIWAPE
jgi:hypothetical protein